MDFLDLKTFLTTLNETFVLFIVFPLVIGFGIYLTFNLKGIQLSKLKLSLHYLLKKEANSQGSISHYQAISAVLAGNFGTGNISGMAVAITTGGPGALVWMWIMAFLGSVIQYASCVLGVKYRQKNETGEFVGGPMYYLSQGLGYHRLAAVFAVFTVLGALTVGNFAQINSVTLPLKALGLDPLFCGFIISGLVGAVLIGGLQRVVSIASVIVPLKAFIYLGTACVILMMHADQIIPALKIMIQSAFSLGSFTGGVVGYGVVKAMTTGFGRGLFATDAGTGIVPILQAGAKTTNPIVDGLVTLIVPFLVMIVCTATSLVLIVTGAWQQPGLYSTNMVTYAFETGLGHSVGAYIVIAALILFAYTTILAWACCAEKAIGYLFNSSYIPYFRYFFIALIPFGAIAKVDIIWLLSDISISLMLVTNLIGVIGLSKEVIYETDAFFGESLTEAENSLNV